MLGHLSYYSLIILGHLQNGNDKDLFTSMAPATFYSITDSYSGKQDPRAFPAMARSSQVVHIFTKWSFEGVSSR